MCDYENPWQYNGSDFDGSCIGDYFGFVYCITNLTNGKKYIGRKYFWQHRKPRGKNRKVRSESNWKKYYGSSDELNKERAEQGNFSFRREILTDGTPAYYNSNILGRYYRKDYFVPLTEVDDEFNNLNA
jgi:hypothetical protein